VTNSGPGADVSSPIASPSPGARWVRAALQVNPYAYIGTKAPSNSYTDEASYNTALVTELLRLGIEMIAVTDHWRARSAQGLIAACEQVGIVALPGFEANASEGVHLLVVFASGTSMTDIDAAIGACGVTPGCAAGCPGRPFSDIVSDMSARGALVIAAHANAPSGLLSGQSGQTRAMMWRHESLSAVAISPGLPIDANDRQIVNNSASDYKRAHPMAVIYADDVCSPGRLSQQGATSWFKMSADTIENLRIALRTPATRVQTDDPALTAHPTVTEIAWEGGFLDGLTLPLSDSLTALIGGRGTGKSTVVESLRYVLDQLPIGARARLDHAEFVRKVLQDATRVSVVIEVLQPSRQVYRIDRTVPDPPIVRDAAGMVLKQSPLDLLGAIEIFSQHELAELADDKSYVAQMLDRFSGPDPDVARRVEVVRELRSNRISQIETMARIDDLDEQLVSLPKMKEQLAQFEAQGVDARLKAQEQVQREERLFATAAARIEAIDAAFTAVDVSGSLDSSFADDASVSELPNAATLKQIQPVITTLSEAVDAARRSLAGAVTTAIQELAQIKARWAVQTASVRSAYEEVIRSLREAGLDGPKYLALGKGIETLKGFESTRADLEKTLESLRDERRQLLAEQADLETTARKRLGEAATAANALVKGYVVVKPVRSSDRREVEALIQRHVPGQRTQIMAAVNRADFSPQSFAAACRTDSGVLAGNYGIKGAQAKALLQAGEPLYLELEEYRVGRAAEAQLNIAPSGSPVYKSLDDLSKGQKATALLLLLLTEANSPLVIDQPEDNLDNRFVFEGIVPRLRAQKGARQVIVSTHNANVPVLGDAELVIALECTDGHGHIAPGGIGSIDDASVRNLAGDLLEGGREAFDARRYLYGY
jgi:AAA domain, putative AbiEii toxin, Type IV TA system